MRSFHRPSFAGLVLLLAPATASGQAGTLSCSDLDRRRDDGVRVCEIRETTVAARARIAVDAEPNGGIRVRAWDGDGVRVRARIETRARSEGRAESLADDVEIETDGTIRASGPRTERRESWTVSFEVFVPRETNLDLRSLNGGIQITGVHGSIEFDAQNGGVRLDGVGGDVRGRTSNGSLQVDLSGSAWEGEGLDVRTTNGSVQVAIPDGYNARLETGTVNGGLRVDFPVTVQGRLGKSLNFDLGRGGKTLRVRTTNGSVRIERS